MRRILSVFAAMFFLTSCGAGVESTEPDALAFVSEESLDQLDPAERVFVDLEASWMCDVLRRSSPEPGVVEEVRQEALEDHAVTAEQYEQFQLSLAERSDLRAAVLARFRQVCDLP